MYFSNFFGKRKLMKNVLSDCHIWLDKVHNLGEARVVEPNFI